MNAPVTNPGHVFDESMFAEPIGAEVAYGFEELSDADLLTSTRRLVGRSNQLLAALLAHLAEVEARGIHRLRACPSLYAYCVYELRLSEDAAFRRARAAKVARKFPVIFRQVADGELHLTALVLLAPHLTEENHRELLALAKHRTKREILRIVRTLAPEPSVPDRVEPLGPEAVGIPVPRPPTWRALVESLAAGVRELAPGDRPKDWVDRAGHVSEELDQVGSEPPANAGAVAATESRDETTLARERYRVQFTASQEYVDLLERAQDLLSHAVPTRSLEEVHLRALRLLVERLEKRKYGAPRTKPSAEPSGRQSTPNIASPVTARCAQQSKKHAQPPRQSGAAAVRREVRDRDGLQCTFVDERGQRCRETRFLELHHELARALGGSETPRNLVMRCQATTRLRRSRTSGGSSCSSECRAAGASADESRPPGIGSEGDTASGVRRSQAPSRALRAAKIFANDRSPNSSCVSPVWAISEASTAPQFWARMK